MQSSQEFIIPGQSDNQPIVSDAEARAKAQIDAFFFDDMATQVDEVLQDVDVSDMQAPHETTSEAFEVVVDYRQLAAMTEDILRARDELDKKTIALQVERRGTLRNLARTLFRHE